jgi:hypothetical protein
MDEGQGISRQIRFFAIDDNALPEGRRKENIIAHRNKKAAILNG